MDKRIIAGYEFTDEEKAKKAKNELSKIAIIQEKSNGINQKKKLELYNQLNNGKIFTTAVGIAFLREMQKELLNSKEIEKQSVKSLLVLDENNTEDKEKYSNFQINNYKLQIKNEKSRSQLFKERFIKSIFVNIFFIIVIIIMFFMVKQGKKYDLSYYQESIEYNYVSWERELSSREANLENNSTDSQK